MPRRNAIDHIAALAAIGEAVVESVRASGLLRRRSGRRKAAKRRTKRRTPKSASE
jgi:hypothetical protein